MNLKVLGLIFLLAGSQAALIVDNSEHEHLVEIIVNFLQYYGTVHCTINIIAESEELSSASHIYNDALQKNSIMTAVTINPEKTETCNIIFVKNFDTFQLYVKKKPKYFLAHKSFYVIVMMEGSKEDVREVLKFMWQVQVYNVNLIYRNNGNVSTYTLHPITSQTCNNTEPEEISTNSQMEKFFPQKFINLHKCLVRVAVYENKPYAFNDCSDSENCRLLGRDSHLLLTIADSMNFVFDRKIFFKAGSITENGNATGPLKLIIEKEVDFAIGDFFLKHLRTKFMDASETYASSLFVFIIPPGTDFSSLENLIGTFSKVVWMFVLSIIGLAFIVILLVNRMPRAVNQILFGEKIKSATMNLISVILGVSIKTLPRLNFIRFLLMNYILFCIVMRTCYIGSLFRLYQLNLKHRKVSTIDEIIERGFTIYSHDSNSDLFKEHPRLEALVKYFNSELDDEILEMIKNPSSDIAFSRQLEKVSYYNEINFYNFQHEVCPERFNSFPIVIYFPKRSFLMDSINKKISQLKSGGFVEYWQSMYVNKKKTLHRSRSHSGPKTLSMKTLIGSFQIWLSLCCLASVVFIAEIIVDKSRKRYAFM